jgi:hypothetical protein
MLSLKIILAMKTTGEETNSLVLIASGSADKVKAELYGELYGKGLVSGNKLTETGKAHLRAIAGAMKHAPGKRTYTVRTSIVLKGRNMQAGETFEASPAGTHVQRWLSEGRIV